MKFMQNPIVQKIVLIFAILFILDMAYRVFVEPSYYLVSSAKGYAYRINKRTGKVYLVKGLRMIPVKIKE